MISISPLPGISYFATQSDGSSKPKERKKGERKFRMQEHLFARNAAAEQARSSSLEPHLPKE